MPVPRPAGLVEASSNAASSLLWRLLVPRRVPLGTFVLLVTIIFLFIGLAIGTSLGIAYQAMLVQLGTTLGLLAGGLVVGLTSVVGLDRLRSRFAFALRPFLGAVFATYLIYAMGGASATVFGLYLRTIPGQFAPLTLAQHGIAVSIVSFAWVFIGLVANQMQERMEKQREYQVALQEKIHDLEVSRRRIVIAQETIRQQIAARLHGPVQTRLLILGKRVEECHAKIRSHPNEALATLAQIGEELDKVENEELRGIARELHPFIIRMGLPAALRSLCDRFGGLIAIKLEIEKEVELLEDPASPLLPEDTRLALYRFAEEALNNVVKHAQATRAILHLWRPDRGQMELCVEDDGVGFAVGLAKPGLGTVTMQDYVSAIGGTYHVESSPHRGTKVAARVPIKDLDR